MKFYPFQTLVIFSSSIFSKCILWINENRSFAIFPILVNFFSFVFTFFFALVGILLGFVSGALIGQESESGFIRGAAVGAISGAVYSLEVFDIFVLLWRSNESAIQCFLYLIDVIVSLLSGKLVRERMGPAILSAVQTQMGAVESGYDELTSIFDIGGTKGLSRNLVEKIPIVEISKEDALDSSGEKVSCSVCLQDVEIGEKVRHFPHCRHMFHIECIDKWLLRHGSCPLCRRHI